MALRLVRQSSETPNITNKDDTKMVRYAYGGYSGIVKNYGSELASVTPSSNGLFKIGSGRVVLQGWEVDIDESGWELINDGLSGLKYYSIYLEVTVLTETVEIKSTYGAGSYPEINIGDDLTEIPNGTARLLLWQVQTNGNNVVETIKVAKTVPYLKDKVNNLENSLTNLRENIFGSGVVGGGVAPLQEYDTTKGTVEERLARLGFKTESIEFGGVAYSPNSDTSATSKQGLFRQGNYVIGKLQKSNVSISFSNANLGNIPDNFRPVNDVYVSVYLSDGSLDYSNGVTRYLKISPSGEVSYIGYVGVALLTYRTIDINFGYEAPPITN